jgi:glutamyl-tRNA reductase
MLSIGVLGINFKTADLFLREAIAKAAQILNAQGAAFFFHPVVVLSTCNRTEIYFSSSDLAEAHSDLLAYLRKLICEPFELHLYSYFGTDCLAHLCRVTSGLDSAILAESEIQRQVKIAYGNAKGLPSCLHYAFQKALKVGKAVRTQFHFGKNSPSLYGKLWRATEWEDRNILLVGNSEINRGFLSFLIHKKIGKISLCTRIPVAEGVCQVYDRTILDEWQRFDIIVCASKSEEFLIAGEGSLHHWIFDLSVPRNVDPEVGKTANLYNIDQLTDRQRSSKHLSECEAFVWINAIQLAKAYRIKTRSVRETLEMGSHP